MWEHARSVQIMPITKVFVRGVIIRMVLFMFQV